MDGGTWCIKDYVRRALRAGFLTYAAEGAPVFYGEDFTLGSLARREETLMRSIAAYNERWGEERSFCIYFPKGADFSAARRSFDAMLTGARQGCSFTVLASPGTFMELVKAGCGSLHRNIRLEKLPRLFSAGSVRRRAAKLRAAAPELVSVSGIEGMPFPGDDAALSFPELERRISAEHAEKYGR
jgi:hypothetical protein